MVDLLPQLAHLKLNRRAILLGQRVVGRLHGQLAHPLEDVVGLVEGPLRRLDEADAVLAVLDGLGKTAGLSPHLLADGKPCRVVRRTVDSQARREFTDGLINSLPRLIDVAVGHQRRDIMIDNHGHPRGPPFISG